jgi:hypothetical protein
MKTFPHLPGCLVKTQCRKTLWDKKDRREKECRPQGQELTNNEPPEV